MKKYSRVLLCLIVITVMALVGCKTTTSKSYTYSVETGDEIVLKLDTSGDYDITYEIPFKITKGEESLSQGTFIKGEAYSIYVESIDDEPQAEVIDSGTKGECEFTMWKFNAADHTEYNYVILINNSNTGVLLANDVSEESAKECFDRLEINLAE